MPIKLFNDKVFLPFASKFLSYFFSLFIITNVWWLNKTFGEVTLDQVLYHLQYGSEGLITADQKIINSYYLKCLMLPVVLSTLLSLLNEQFLSFLKSTFLKLKATYKQLSEKSKTLRILSKCSARYLLLVVAVSYVSVQLSIPSYLLDLINPNKIDLYAKHYIAPPNQLQVTAPKNLVLIYVESLENTYSDSELFGQDLLQNISANELSGISFNQQRQLPGTGWTMAGIVATQCGVPLKASFGGGGRRDNDATEVSRDFLPNITCLGDILKSKGYQNIFIGGASLDFAGKGKFFKSHGYDKIYGRDELLKILGTNTPQNHWGVFDDALINYAKQEIDTLENSGKPYNLTLLTSDTHMPEGSYSKTCIAQGAVKFKDIIKCTSTMLNALVVHMDKLGYLKNTTVVIMGDHLAMTNPLSKKLNNKNDRFVFNNYIVNNRLLTKKRDNIYHVDHLPTILESINFNIPNSRLGLGISGFTHVSPENLAVRHEELINNSTKPSATYLGFWHKAQ